MLNPVGSTQALTLDDGRAIAESNASPSALSGGGRALHAARQFTRWALRARQGDAVAVLRAVFREEPVIGSLRFWT